LWIFQGRLNNTNSYGYNAAIILKGIPYETESWGWLLDERYHDKVAIVNAPAIGILTLRWLLKRKI